MTIRKLCAAAAAALLLSTALNAKARETTTPPQNHTTQDISPMISRLPFVASQQKTYMDMEKSVATIVRDGATADRVLEAVDIASSCLVNLMHIDARSIPPQFYLGAATRLKDVANTALKREIGSPSFERTTDMFGSCFQTLSKIIDIAKTRLSEKLVSVLNGRATSRLVANR